MSLSDGWVPMEAATWPLVVAALERGAEPWPRELCALDLRWHYDQKGRLPGRPALVKRWRVTDRTARAILAAVDEWWDPKKGVQPVSSRRPARVQPASSRHTDEPSQSQESVQRASSERPAHVQPMSTRAEIHPTHSPSQPQTDVAPASPPLEPVEAMTEDPTTVINLDRHRPPRKPAAAASPEGAKQAESDEFRAAAEYAGQVLNPAVGRGLSHGPSRSSKQGQRLAREVKKDAAKVMKAMQYVAENQSEHAEYLRSQGYGLETVLRHLDEYAERASARGPPERGYHPPVVAKHSDEEIEAMRAQLLAENPGWT